MGMKPSDEYKVCSLEDADVFARKREQYLSQQITQALDRKPLSEEEINKLYIEHGNSEWDWQIKFARAIEERHGIK
jgi:hypothetical protein